MTHLPDTRAAASAVPASLPSGVIQDLGRDLAGAWAAVRGHDLDDADASVELETVVKVTGPTPAAALRAAADIAERSPQAVMDSLVGVRVYDATEDAWEYRITLTLGFNGPG